MRSLIIGSEHWMDIDAIRQELTMLPISSTVIIGERSGCDVIVARIAKEELALDVEVLRSDDYPSFRQCLSETLVSGEIDSCFFFIISNKEMEHSLIRQARACRIETTVVKQNDKN